MDVKAVAVRAEVVEGYPMTEKRVGDTRDSARILQYKWKRQGGDHRGQ